ncbi:hypothetical protein Bca4012_087373 [Brassica carinata]
MVLRLILCQTRALLIVGIVRNATVFVKTNWFSSEDILGHDYRMFLLYQVLPLIHRYSRLLPPNEALARFKKTYENYFRIGNTT